MVDFKLYEDFSFGFGKFENGPWPWSWDKSQYFIFCDPVGFSPLNNFFISSMDMIDCGKYKISMAFRYKMRGKDCGFLSVDVFNGTDHKEAYDNKCRRCRCCRNH